MQPDGKPPAGPCETMLPMSGIRFKKLLYRLSRYGLRAVARDVGHYVYHGLVFGGRRLRQLNMLEAEDGFDRRYGTDTSSLVPVRDLGVEADAAVQAVLYFPSLFRTVQTILARLELDHREFTFIDIGSGKGRVLLTASAYPFRRIIGVEISRALHAVAQRNVRMFRSPDQRCREISLVCADARDFEFPADNLVLYLFDPFDEGVFKQVIAKLSRSLAQTPREVWLVYLHNRLRSLIEQSGLFDLVCDVPRVGPQHVPVEYAYCLYRHGSGSKSSGPGG